MEVILATWTGDNRERMLQMIQNQLKQVNIDASIEVMDIGTLNARDTQENNKAEGPGYMDLMGWTWFDPDLLYLLWHSPGAYEGFTRLSWTRSSRRRAPRSTRPSARRSVMRPLGSCSRKPRRCRSTPRAGCGSMPFRPIRQASRSGRSTARSLARWKTLNRTGRAIQPPASFPSPRSRNCPWPVSSSSAFWLRS